MFGLLAVLTVVWLSAFSDQLSAFGFRFLVLGSWFFVHKQYI